MAIKVLWLEDRFGIPANYLGPWIHALRQANIQPTEVKRVSLHRLLHGQLLTKYANRKAPTWRPEREAEIKAAIKALISQLQPDIKCVVLAAPESLCITGLDPSYATLATLRGSVYDFNGVPALVTLPMSAWFTQVSQKDVAVANYGIESEAMMEAFANAKRAQGADSGTRPDHGAGHGRDHGTHAVGADDPHDPAGSESLVDGDPGDDFLGDGDHSESSDSEDSESVPVNDSVDGDDEDDNFFYVPVMTPVGKIMITFDIRKLGRIVHGESGAFFDP